jgi:hypothetical protein
MRDLLAGAGLVPLAVHGQPHCDTKGYGLISGANAGSSGRSRPATLRRLGRVSLVEDSPRSSGRSRPATLRRQLLHRLLVAAPGVSLAGHGQPRCDPASGPGLESKSLVLWPPTASHIATRSSSGATRCLPNSSGCPRPATCDTAPLPPLALVVVSSSGRSQPATLRLVAVEHGARLAQDSPGCSWPASLRLGDSVQGAAVSFRSSGRSRPASLRRDMDDGDDAQRVGDPWPFLASLIASARSNAAACSCLAFLWPFATSLIATPWWSRRGTGRGRVPLAVHGQPHCDTSSCHSRAVISMGSSGRSQPATLRRVLVRDPARGARVPLAHRGQPHCNPAPMITFTVAAVVPLAARGQPHCGFLIVLYLMTWPIVP